MFVFRFRVREIAYSLMALPELGKSRWGLGVLLGGSRFMHSFKVDDVVSVSAPVNQFRLHEKDALAILFTGGIGITPILSMAAALNARRTSYRAHYAGRMPKSLTFLPQMRTICATALSVHHDCAENRLDICLPGDIAHAVEFFPDERSSFVTGQVLNVWGGPVWPAYRSEQSGGCL